MKNKTTTNQNFFNSRFSLKKSLIFAMAPLPLPVVNLILARMIQAISHNHPEIFRRIDGHHQKKFLINVTNLPFVFCLCPHPLHPELVALRRRKVPDVDGKISGSFLTLLGMIDGRYDGDALFFTRDLKVAGDTEAIVCLRNALDDVDGSIADDIAAFFGLFGTKFLKAVRRIKIHA